MGVDRSFLEVGNAVTAAAACRRLWEDIRWMAKGQLSVRRGAYECVEAQEDRAGHHYWRGRALTATRAELEGGKR